jgi:CHAT domain-containing protein
LLFADGVANVRGGDGTRWISWSDLVELPWRARVVTFSGCSTAVGGPRHGRGLYGISQSAMNSGAGSVLASLWPVDDLQTAAFMTAVYDDVRAQWDAGRDADLRLALRAGAERLESDAPAPADKRRPVTRDAREFDVLAAVSGGSAGSGGSAEETYAWSVADAFTLVGDPILANR